MAEKEEIKTLNRRIGNFKGIITKLGNWLGENKELASSEELQTRLERAEKILDDYYNVMLELEIKDEKTNYDKDKEDFENDYYKCIASVKEILNERAIYNLNKSRESIASVEQIGLDTESELNIKLPTIHLPTFDGEYEQWYPFKDTFGSLIHNNKKIPNVQKFYYLNSCLKGKARELLASLEISNNNYTVGWDLLKNRYENPKLIKNAHVNALFDLTAVGKHHNQSGLRNLIDTFSKHKGALEALGEPVSSWDTLLIKLVTTKLDNSTRNGWEENQKNNNNPTVEQLIDYLQEKCRISETISSEKAIQGTKSSVHSAVQGRGCVVCGDREHYIYKCAQFLKLQIKERIDKVKELSLCIKCLKPNHFARECKANNCWDCKKPHNTLLHIKKHVEEGKKAVATHSLSEAQVVLTTAIVKVKGLYGKLIQARAMLDVGADCNFISEKLFKKLKFTKSENVDISITGMGCRTSKVNKKIKLEIKSRHNNFSSKLDFLIIDKITTCLPVIKIDKNKINLPENVKLADPTFDIPGEIDLLIGAEIFYELLTAERNDLGGGTVLQGSRLGWLVTGKVGMIGSKDKICNLSVKDSEIHEQLENFWKIEEINGGTLYSKDEMRCESEFVESTGRGSGNHFIVSLPLKEKITLGNSKETALKRFYNLEKRLIKDRKLFNEYSEFLNEYLTLGHMERYNDTDREKLFIKNKEIVPYYIPHHPVIKESSTTTKVRVVFDASCKTTNGKSLNDTLMVGPVIQSDLFSILLRFRTHNVVLVGDIEKMYRQVWVHPEFYPLQLILWRDDVNSPVATYKLKTLTYGTAPASFLATRCLRELAIENVSSYPEEAEIINNDFYMDDLITGGKDVESVAKLKSNITNILSTGGFKLRKFASNEDKILGINNEVNEEHVLRDRTESRTLGVLWDSTRDIFEFCTDISCSEGIKVTKREVLSIIAKIFDPLGLIQPIIILLKMFLQQLWKRGMNWDEELPDELKPRWAELRETIDQLKVVSVPRPVLLREYVQLELHGFADASELAYGAVIYLRTINDANEIKVTLLCSKSKVAPTKKLTLPRLELSGALLLAKLVKSVMKNIRLKLNNLYYWTDSNIVLGWLNGDPNHWKTFVGNRVAKIQELSEISQWHHISGKMNPADILSRGTTTILNSEWFSGPSFLYSEPLTFSKVENIAELGLDLEKKTLKTVCMHIRENELMSRFSSVRKLIRVVAWMLRFIKNCRDKRENGNLKIEELDKALSVLIKLVQEEAFAQDIKQLKKGGVISTNSKLLRLHPFLDREGILRVGGRLSRATVAFDVKYPMVLPKTHRFTRLLIEAEHLKLLHAGPQAVLASLRQRYWPLCGRDSVRNVLRKCVVCFKAQPINSNPLMGDLPSARLRPVRPFYNTALDYAGPFWIKDGKLRNRKIIKCYLCVFVCFVTRAVHLELTTELTTSSFLQVLNRFVARRGVPKTLHSDNGTNFVGAYNELKTIKGNLEVIAKDEGWANYLAENSIEWYFMPARAPHMGGLHEAAVKSAKRHLVRVVGNARLTYEQLYTVVCQTEGILNSRPLFPSSNDPSDLSVLTPGHFLIGEQLNSIPTEPAGATSGCKIKDFLRMKEIASHFWQRWHREYLNTLQQRSKWQRQKPSAIKVGTMVLLREERIPVQLWRLGRITEVFPGKDGVIRVVEIHTAHGQTRRAVATICPLPISDSE